MCKGQIIPIVRILPLGNYLLAEDARGREYLTDKAGKQPIREVIYLPHLAQRSQ